MFVSQIITAKQFDLEADTYLQEQKIDKIIYELYGLTPEEIAVVEGRAA